MAFADEVIRRQIDLRADRFAVKRGTPTMAAVVTTGAGGLDRLEYREVPRPSPGAGEVLLQVLAAGVNPTDVNTRLGWYAAGVTAGAASATQEAAGSPDVSGDGGWRGATPFPFIQGTDCCGRVVEVGAGGDARLIGRRVLARPCMRPLGFASMETVWLGSDFDGAFAQYARVPASEVFAVDCALSDVELGAIPCASGTAENMLCRAAVAEGEHVLVVGASGGVGSAVVQLAKRRGALVTALARRDRADQVLALGADRVVGDDDPAGLLGQQSVDVVVDNVSGPQFGAMLGVLRRGGRYVSSGAIAGPLVAFDKRTFYLKDLTLIGCTAWEQGTFAAVVAAVEAGDLRLPVAGTFPLERIAVAQTALLEGRPAGKLVLIPPPGV